jgi:hypothetical protein
MAFEGFMSYNSVYHVGQNTRALCISKAARLSQSDIVSKALFVSNLRYVLAVPRDNGSVTCEERFVMGLIDETGNRYGNLTVIERAKKNSKSGHAYWLCKCDCGNKTEIASYNLRSGRTTRCWNCQPNAFIDETGNRYGQLLVIEYSGPHPEFGYAMWKCHCDCGGEKIVSGQGLRKGAYKSCHLIEAEEAAFRSLISNWRGRARGKGLPFTLTKEQLLDLTKQNCFYCGSLPFQVKKHPYRDSSYVYNGLDRVDNSKGYTIDNVVPCCGICNHTKATLSQDEFKMLICRIYEYWASKDC